MWRRRKGFGRAGSLVGPGVGGASGAHRRSGEGSFAADVDARIGTDATQQPTCRGRDQSRAGATPGCAGRHGSRYKEGGAGRRRAGTRVGHAPPRHRATAAERACGDSSEHLSSTRVGDRRLVHCAAGGPVDPAGASSSLMWEVRRDIRSTVFRIDLRLGWSTGRPYAVRRGREDGGHIERD